MSIIILFHCLLSFLFCNLSVKSFFASKYAKQYASNYGLSMSSSFTESKPREFRHLRPLPCIGVYEPEDNVRLTSLFLGPDKMTVRDLGDGRCITQGIVPIPIREDFESGLVAAMKPENRSTVYKSWNSAVLTDRDGGFFDNLTPILSWAPKSNARKDIYESLRLRGSSASPYHGLLNAIDTHAELSITGLLIEIADRPSKFSLSLGAAVLVARKSCAQKWYLSQSRTRLVNEAKGSNEARLIKCNMDELLGIAYATKFPIVIPENLYGSVSVNGLIQKEKNVKVLAPYFQSNQELKQWKLRMKEMQEREESRTVTFKTKKAGDIADATTYLKMTINEKRACLRATGVTVLPRPREGPRAVDAILIPLLDEEVAYEILRRLAETRGDFEAAAEMEDFESRKPLLASMIYDAKLAGDAVKAKTLCEELNSLSTLRWDPTNADVAAGDWDVEEWYWEQRKRVYGIVAW